MHNKNRSISYSIYVFAFIYSGIIIYSPYYSAGNPVFNFVASSISGILYAFILTRLFTGGRTFLIKAICLWSAIFSVISSVFVVSEYVKELAGFADYYAEWAVSLFAVMSIITCSVLCVRKGKVGAFAFAELVFPLFVAWTLSGFFAFFATRNVVLLDKSIFAVSGVVEHAVKSAVYLCFDITFSGAILFAENNDKASVSGSLIKGTVWFVLLSGINLVKNLLLFGKDFALAIKNPDLASLRLVPMFDLPEISVVVNTFAGIVRLSACFYIVFVVAKDIFGRKKVLIKESQ